MWAGWPPHHRDSKQTSLGKDLSLVLGKADPDALHDMEGEQDLFGWFGRAVYVGDDVMGAPVFLFQQTGPSIIDLVKGWIGDVETTGIFGSSYDCCRSQSSIDGTPVLNQPTRTTVEVEGRRYAVTEMWGLQGDVAIVAFIDEHGTPLGWQRPVSNYVGARFGETSANGLPDVRMVAYNSAGEILEEASWPLIRG